MRKPISSNSRGMIKKKPKAITISWVSLSSSFVSGDGLTSTETKSSSPTSQLKMFRPRLRLAPAPITAAGLELFGAGPFTLTNAGNDFIGQVNLAAAYAAVTDANAIVIGDVDVDDLVVLASGTRCNTR